MACRLTGQMSAVQIEIGGVQDCTPTWASPINLKALARRWGIDETARTADLSALGDTRDVVQVTRASSTIELELLVGDTGFQFTNMIGYYARVGIKALSTLASYTTYTGVITGYRVEAPDGAQTEVIRVMCDANGGSA